MRTETKKPTILLSQSTGSKQEKEEKAETVDTYNGELVKTKDLESFARKILSAAFFQKCFRESHARKLNENRPFANRRPPWIHLYGAFSQMITLNELSV